MQETGPAPMQTDAPAPADPKPADPAPAAPKDAPMPDAAAAAAPKAAAAPAPSGGEDPAVDSKWFQDPAFVQELLGSLPGVDINDARIQAALQEVGSDDKDKDKQGEEKKDGA